MKNVGRIDKIVRVVIAFDLFVLYMNNLVIDKTGLILIVGSIILLVTGLVEFCPIYYLLRIKTSVKSK